MNCVIIVDAIFMEKYSSGRRGVTRNLVGRESVAWVQIPPSPPTKRAEPRGSALFMLIFSPYLQNTAVCDLSIGLDKRILDACKVTADAHIDRASGAARIAQTRA